MLTSFRGVLELIRAALHDRGVLTDDEFAAEKNAILAAR